MKSQGFAPRLIHEINNPLSVISARTELLLLKTKKNSSQEKSLKAIQEQLERIEGITRNVSYYFKSPKLMKNRGRVKKGHSLKLGIRGGPKSATP